MKIQRFIICFLIIVFMGIQSGEVLGKDKDIWQLSQEFIQKGESAISGNQDVKDFEVLAGLLTGVGIFIAVGTAIILGIRFMAASVAKRAEIMQSMTPFLIGTAIVVGAVTIWRILIEILNV